MDTNPLGLIQKQPLFKITSKQDLFAYISAFPNALTKHKLILEKVEVLLPLDTLIEFLPDVRQCSIILSTIHTNGDRHAQTMNLQKLQFDRVTFHERPKYSGVIDFLNITRSRIEGICLSDIKISTCIIDTCESSHGNILIERAEVINDFVIKNYRLVVGFTIKEAKLGIKVVNSSIDKFVLTDTLSIQRTVYMDSDVRLLYVSKGVHLDEFRVHECELGRMSLDNKDESNTFDMIELKNSSFNEVVLPYMENLEHFELKKPKGSALIEGHFNAHRFLDELAKNKEVVILSNTNQHDVDWIQEKEEYQRILRFFRQKTAGFSTQIRKKLVVKERKIIKQMNELSDFPPRIPLVQKRLLLRKDYSSSRRYHSSLYDLITNYGISKMRVIWTSLATIVFFGFLYYLLLHALPSVGDSSAPMTLLDTLYYSGITFSTVGYGDLYYLNVIVRFFSVLEGLIGIGLMAVFVSVLVESKKMDWE